MKYLSALAAFVATVSLAHPGLTAEQAPGDQPSSAQSGSAVKLHGVVNSINAAAGRANITHDPVPALKWPAMKMNFKARDPALLKDLKPGMAVDFQILKAGDEYVIVSIVPVP
jgi:Cu/Ag efflux protein CusF